VRVDVGELLCGVRGLSESEHSKSPVLNGFGDMAENAPLVETGHKAISPALVF
jgi:hypothetical protein